MTTIGPSERGVVRDMLEGRITKKGYVTYLRNLHEIYDGLERCLAASGSVPPEIAAPELHRAAVIACDLSSMVGSEWTTKLSVCAAARAYRDRIESVAGHDSALVGHSYVRYLGDLSGGQLLSRHLRQHLGLSEQELCFYRFEKIEDIAATKRRFRRSLDRFGQSLTDPQSVVREAQRAFKLNIAVSLRSEGMCCLGTLGSGVSGQAANQASRSQDRILNGFE